MRPTRAHPYIVFSGTSRATGAREFLCVLCKSTFSFDTAHPASPADSGVWTALGSPREQVTINDESGEDVGSSDAYRIPRAPESSEGTGGVQ